MPHYLRFYVCSRSLGRLERWDCVSIVTLCQLKVDPNDCARNAPQRTGEVARSKEFGEIAALVTAIACFGATGTR